jgi:hypothetical protein
MASVFAELDRLIVEPLELSPDGLSMAYLFDPQVREEVRRIAAKTKRAASEVLDGRLRALREAGLITLDSRRGRLTYVGAPRGPDARARENADSRRHPENAVPRRHPESGA